MLKTFDEFNNFRMSEKDYIESEIFAITQYNYEMLEISTEVIFGELEDRLLVAKQQNNEIENKIITHLKTNKEDSFPFFDDLDQNNNEIRWVSEHLKIISEMRIIYLFKSVETNIKSIIEIAYPAEKSNNLYRWDFLKTFLKNKNINLTEIPDYKDINELRKVNNSLKHNSEFSDEILIIKEFNFDIYDLDYKNMDNFYNRLKMLTAKFVRTISKKIIEEKFLSSDCG